MVICAAAKRKRRSPKQDLESTTGSREFQGTVDTTYTCKWFAPLNEVHIEEPDYHAFDVWDKALQQGRQIVGGGDGFDDDGDWLQNYRELKQKYRATRNDFDTLIRIANLIVTLSEEYQGLTKDNVTGHIRVLQRKIAKLKEQIKSCQVGRIDLSIPSRDASKRVCHTYRFPSEKMKEDWICAVRYAKLRLSAANRCAWVTGEDIEEEDEEVFSLTHKLPLVVESTRLNMVDKSTSVTCAAKVGLNTAWLAGGDRNSAQVTVVECVTPTPIVLECFQVLCSRITDIVYVPPATMTQNEATLTATMKRVSMRSTLQSAGSLTTIPPHMATVWLGSQCGKLSLYSAESMGDGTKKCLATVKFDDAVTSMCYYHDQVYVSTAEGNVIVFRRSGSIGWDLVNRRVVEVTNDKNVTIRCSCRVVNKLWLAVGVSCHILNLQTLKIQTTLPMSTNESSIVTHMVCWGEGVWVSYRNTAALQLWHTISKKQLQDIDIKQAIAGIIATHHLEAKLKLSEFVHVTSLMASSGFLWIGTSIGLILVYRIPHLEGIPIVSGKPYLAMDGHKGAVRVLLPVKTKATISSSRVDQFLSDEQRRFSLISQPDDDEQEEEEVDGETPGKSGTLTEGSVVLGNRAEILERSGEEQEVQEEEKGDGAGTEPHEVTGPTDDGSRLQGTEEEEAENGNGIDEVSFVPPFPLNLPPPDEDDETFEALSLTGEEIPVDDSDQPLEEEIEQDQQVELDPQVKPATTWSEEQIGDTASEQVAMTVEDVDELFGGEGDVANSSANVGVGQSLEIEDKKVVTKLENPYEFSEEVLVDKLENTFGVVRQNGTGEVEREEIAQPLQNGHLVDESGIYSAPIELDLRPHCPRAMKKEEENGYAIPHELLPPSVSKRTVVPAGYESPSVLNDRGPVTTRGGLFSPEIGGGISPTTFTLPGRITEPKQGAIFVLTSGRGLVNLRPGIRTPFLFPTFTSGTGPSTPVDKADEEGCMISYEIEMLQ